MRTISTFYEFSLGNASSGVHVDIVKIIVSGRSPNGRIDLVYISLNPSVMNLLLILHKKL